MTTPRALRPDFKAIPKVSDRQLARTARDAALAADATESLDAPSSLPKHTYGITRERRAKLLDERTTQLDEQRFSTEMDWQMTIAQLEAVKAIPDARPDEITNLENVERQCRIRIISLDAAYARLSKRTI